MRNIAHIYSFSSSVSFITHEDAQRVLADKRTALEAQDGSAPEERRAAMAGLDALEDALDYSSLRDYLQVVARHWWSQGTAGLVFALRLDALEDALAAKDGTTRRTAPRSLQSRPTTSGTDYKGGLVGVDYKRDRLQGWPCRRRLQAGPTTREAL